MSDRELKRMQEPWTIKTTHFEEYISGTLSEALETATGILLLEAEWPTKGKMTVTARISRGDDIFTLALATPYSPRRRPTPRKPTRPRERNA